MTSHPAPAAPDNSRIPEVFHDQAAQADPNQTANFAGDCGSALRGGTICPEPRAQPAINA